MLKLRNKGFKFVDYPFLHVYLGRERYSTNNHNKELDPGYVPHQLENLPRTRDYFKVPIKSTKPFTLVLPPPNITGTLHLGHALTTTIQDVIIRWKRMQGIETIWVPGMDHAGIATQMVVEKLLFKLNKETRHNIGREKFLEKVEEWRNEKSSIIGKQLRDLGVLLDWEKEVFTLDKQRSKAVLTAFIQLFDAGLIYRSDSLVNWSCILKSAISDIEVEQLSIVGPTKINIPGYEKPVEFGTLTKFAYKIEGSEQEEIVVATTRPETMLGDVAVAVHPDDHRYSRFIGLHAVHPFRQELIPIVADSFVDREFGTGAVKITPAHNLTDYDVAKRHNLNILSIIDESGLLTSECKKFTGLPRFKAREIIIENLKTLGTFRGQQDHSMVIPICSRSKDVVELLIRPQWFIKCDSMASEAIKSVKEGRLTIEPKVLEKNWFTWLENIRDWCISRQLWWGHQIPAYFCTSNKTEKTVWVAAETQEAASKKAASKLGVEVSDLEVKQDEDVLDTWFSSALHPFSAFGWPDKTEDLSKFYPLSLMETGHDILFFWVARMVMLGTQLTGQLPFSKVLLHGVICDSYGRKMSKSLGNVVAPEDVIKGVSLEDMKKNSVNNYSLGLLSKEELERSIQGQQKMFPEGIPECGSDALRFTLLSHNIKSTETINRTKIQDFFRAIHRHDSEPSSNSLNMSMSLDSLPSREKFDSLLLENTFDPYLFDNIIKSYFILGERLYINFVVSECYTNKLFCNKIWQATKFTKLWFTKISNEDKLNYNIKYDDLQMTDKWILSKLAYMVDRVNEGMEDFDFFMCTKALKKFLYYEFCDIYLETTKRALFASDKSVASGHLWTLVYCLDVALRSLAPFMPILSEHLHHHLPIFPGQERVFEYPQKLNWYNQDLEKNMEELMDIIVAIRRLKKTFNISPKTDPKVYLISNSFVLKNESSIVEDLTGFKNITITENLPNNVVKNSLKDKIRNTFIHIEVSDEIKKSLEVDLQKIQSKREKLQRDLEKLKKMVSGSTYYENVTLDKQQMHSKKISSLEEHLSRLDYFENIVRN